MPSKDEAEKFLTDLSECLTSLNEMYELNAGFKAEEYGMDTKLLQSIISMMVSVDGQVRIAARKSIQGDLAYIPTPQDVQELCLKSFMLGFVYARRVLTSED